MLYWSVHGLQQVAEPLYRRLLAAYPAELKVVDECLNTDHILFTDVALMLRVARPFMGIVDERRQIARWAHSTLDFARQPTIPAPLPSAVGAPNTTHQTDGGGGGAGGFRKARRRSRRHAERRAAAAAASWETSPRTPMSTKLM